MRLKTGCVGALLSSLLLVGVSPAFAGGPDTDTDLQDRIRDQLEHLHIKDLGVQVLGWAVTLGGTAESLAQTEQAAKIASGQAGIKEVFSDLQVERVPDDALQSAVTEALEKDRHHYTIYDLVHVSVEDGRAFLSGHAIDATAAGAIGETVTKVRGVSAIDNEIDTSPMSRADEELQTAIVFSINRALTPYLEARPSVHVMVKDGHVTLSGLVDGAGAREAVDKAVKSADGVLSVADAVRGRRS